MELLAPAGTKENFIAALEAGADAIYMGGKAFNARAHAANFDDEALRDAVRLAHLCGVRIFVTVNILIGDTEIKALTQYLQALASMHVDAIIVQDLAVARIAKEVAPSLALHGSTQMTASNLETVQYLEALGFERVVLSRELSLDEIRHICANAKAEIEVFIHGALCVSYSGQCLMSSFIGGRSGNRGSCAQPCRLPYTLVDEEGKHYTSEAAPYIMSPKDLNYADAMKDLMAAGVTSFKVEGRMKHVSYVKQVISTYRQIIDDGGCVTAQRKEALQSCFNRGFSTAYLDNNGGKHMITAVAPNNQSGKRHTVQVNEPGWRGLQDFTRTYNVTAYLYGEEGQPVGMSLVLDDEHQVYVVSDYVLARAKNKPTTKEYVYQQLSRMGTTVFRLQSVDMPEGPYMWPASVLNSLRRDAVAALEESLLATYDAMYGSSKPKEKQYLPPFAQVNLSERSGSTQISVQVDTLEGVKAALRSGAKKIIFGGDRLSRRAYTVKEIQDVAACVKADPSCHLMFTSPRIQREEDKKQWHPLWKAMVEAEPHSFGVHYLGALNTLASYGYTGAVEGDASLQIFNQEALTYYRTLGFSGVTVSQEATLQQIGDMCKHQVLPVEVIVHGYNELMISEYCAISSFAGTGKKKGCPAPCLQHQFMLLDRKGEAFPLRTDPQCRMHVMNSHVLDMRPYIPQLQQKGIRWLRIDGRQQEAQWIEDVVASYVRILNGEEAPPKKASDGSITRGHYFKGILDID